MRDNRTIDALNRRFTGLRTGPLQTMDGQKLRKNLRSLRETWEPAEDLVALFAEKITVYLPWGTVTPEKFCAVALDVLREFCKDPPARVSKKVQEKGVGWCRETILRDLPSIAAVVGDGLFYHRVRRALQQYKERAETQSTGSPQMAARFFF